MLFPFIIEGKSIKKTFQEIKLQKITKSNRNVLPCLAIFVDIFSLDT